MQNKEEELVENQTKPKGIEKRKWPRYQISIPVVITYRERQINHSPVKNISSGGLLCLLSERLNIGEIAKISMNLHKSDKSKNSFEIFFEAKVVRVETDEEKGDRKNRRTAFQFVNIDTNFQSLLQAYLDLRSNQGDSVKLI